MVRRSISRIINGLAEAEPDRVIAVAVTAGGDRTLTADGLETASNRYARLLQARGVRRDDLVTIALPNGLEMLVVCAAVWKAGATPQPVSRGLTPHEGAAVVAAARPAAVIGFAADGVPCLPEPIGLTGPDRVDGSGRICARSDNQPSRSSKPPCGTLVPCDAETLMYFWQQADGFWEHVLATLEAAI